MAMSRTASGFTLIELMIVVAIIAILAAIALPAYNLYRIKAAEAACEMEMKNYANFALVALHVGGTPGGPPQRACLTTTTATALTVPIIGTPQTPGSKQTTCDMNTATCTIAT